MVASVEWRSAIKLQEIFFLWMSTGDLANFVCLVGPAVNKKNSNFRNAISVKEHLQ